MVGRYNPDCAAEGPAKDPSGFFTGTLGLCDKAILMMLPLVVFTFSLVVNALKLTPNFNHLFAWLSKFTLTEPLLKPEPKATPSCDK